MARIRIIMPEHFSFSTLIPIRITDLNYAGHVGNDMVLSILHEARVQYLMHFGYQESDLSGTGLIMTDVSIEFKKELFYGDTIIASVLASEFSRVGFELFYKLETRKNGTSILVANAKTAMVCFDYGAKKVVSIPAIVVEKLKSP
jgi:acyl-CoA thioester hydrolase